MNDHNSIVLIGGGGHCKSVLDSALTLNKYSNIYITDPSLKEGSEILGCKVVGTDAALPRLYDEGVKQAFITIGSIKSVKKRIDAYKRAKEIGFEFPNIIDPSAVVSDTAIISDGVYIGKGTIINSEAKIGAMSIINTGAVIEHECIIGEFVHVAVGTVLCGNCEVGNNSFIGANATVIQGTTIGKDSIIGAGSVVVSDVPGNEHVVGLYKGIAN